MSRAKKSSIQQPGTHWRSIASNLFPEHGEFISSDDEEHDIYNLFFQLAEAVSQGDARRVAIILDFAGQCLEGVLHSDGTNLSSVAGVSLFEHLFEDSMIKRWGTIFAAMPHRVFLKCRPYAECWMGAEAFSRVDEAAKKHYR